DWSSDVCSSDLARFVAIPQLLYNVPGRTGVDMKTETVLRLAEVPNIVGIKEATGDIPRARDLIARAPKGFAVISGDDATAVELILSGGVGDISVTANVVPAAIARIDRKSTRLNSSHVKISY